jgi:2-(1,2-epoxy-1,2-dihydrophenyl)acetyl-CoA isomerase
MAKPKADDPEEAPAPVLRRFEAGVAWITLNRPEAGNALTADMREQIIAWLEDASADLAVRAVVLTGAGEKGFCTGADLRAATAGPVRPAGAPDRAVGDAARMIRTGWQRLVSAVLDCEKPVIAAVTAGPGLRSRPGRRGGEVHRRLRATGDRP